MNKDWLNLRRQILEIIHDHQSLLDRVEMELLRSSSPVSHARLGGILLDIYKLDGKLLEYIKLLTPLDQFITKLQEKYQTKPQEMTDEIYRNTLLAGLIKLLGKD